MKSLDYFLLGILIILLVFLGAIKPAHAQQIEGPSENMVTFESMGGIDLYTPPTPVTLPDPNEYRLYRSDGKGLLTPEEYREMIHTGRHIQDVIHDRQIHNIPSGCIGTPIPHPIIGCIFHFNPTPATVTHWN